MSAIRNLIGLITTPFGAVIALFCLIVGVFAQSGRDAADDDEAYGDMPGPIDPDHYR